MNKIVLFITFITLAGACTPKGANKMTSICESSGEKLRKCPTGLQEIFLPRSYSASSIYIGFGNDDIHMQFINRLIENIPNDPSGPKVNIIIPRNEIIEAHEKLVPLFKHPKTSRINFIGSGSDDTIWMQDYFEQLTDTKTGRSHIVDLPYMSREGENIPASLALSCKKDLITQADHTSATIQPGNGDYGGNIEAISEKIVLVGNNITQETFALLSKLTTQKLVTLDVSWLETGHVDELYSILPHSEKASACEQTLVYASPALAQQLVQNAKNIQYPRYPSYSESEVASENWPEFDHCLDPKYHENPECKHFDQANATYEKIIQNNIQTIQTIFQQIHGCKLETLPLPLFFSPIQSSGEIGTSDDRAVALNANSINNIFFWPNLFIPKQNFLPFQEWMDQKLKRFSLSIHYIDGEFVHHLLGGIHCATNISYACAP